MQYSRRLIADVLLPRVPAEIALHVAAPDEPAVALLGDVADPRLVAPAAAQQPASVQAEGRPVAYPSSRARDAEPATARMLMTVFTMLRVEEV